ncbi:MAG: LysR family transcriptional regulator [Tistlia sp.]|uniref:LysR family transcriptional regulator n=1 Tax=Tistlia sp. TaxID=3057121 RepID=UPI0034A205C5
MFGIRDVEMVGEVVRAGGFRAAARRLGLAQSAISARLAALEKRLGIKLFERAGRGVRLTAAGRRFLEQAERLIAARDRIVDELAATADLVGTLRIGVAETVVHTWLPAMLTQLRDALPRMRFELAVDTSAELRRKLAGDELDFAILMRPLVPAEARQFDIGGIEICWVAAPGLALPEGPLAPADLAQRPIVTFPKSTPPYREIERLLSDPGLPVPLLHGCASLSTIAHLVRDGFGIGTLPRRMVQADLASGALRELRVVEAARLEALDFVAAYLPGRNDRLAEVLVSAARAAAAADS